MGPPGPCRPQMGPYWPHEPCYQGICCTCTASYTKLRNLPHHSGCRWLIILCIIGIYTKRNCILMTETAYQFAKTDTNDDTLIIFILVKISFHKIEWRPRTNQIHKAKTKPSVSLYLIHGIIFGSRPRLRNVNISFFHSASLLPICCDTLPSHLIFEIVMETPLVSCGSWSSDGCIAEQGPHRLKWLNVTMA